MVKVLEVEPTLTFCGMLEKQERPPTSKTFVLKKMKDDSLEICGEGLGCHKMIIEGVADRPMWSKYVRRHWETLSVCLHFYNMNF